tara:strand:+ start:467 stop:1354 length:888 start_codon:yes stop_codon:yes gene_type:complete
VEKLDKHEYKYQEIVIGGGLSALLYSYYNNCPCIFSKPDVPFEFDVFDDKYDFSFLGSIDDQNRLTIWQRLIASLSLGGLLPMSDKVENVSIQESRLKAVTKNSRLGRFEFEKLTIFDDREVRGLPRVKEQKIGKCRVIDWFHVRSGMEHDHNLLQTKDEFIKEVIFYPSDRFGNQTSGRVRKDLVALSHLDEAQLNDFDYSDTMAKFKITQMMKDAGIKGARNGKDMYNPNIYRYYSPKVEAVEREVRRDIKNFYHDDGRFEFRYETPEEIIENYICDPCSYTSKITELLYKNN